jgi:hypothetical protein
MFPLGREHEFTGKLIKIDNAGEETSTSGSNLFIFEMLGKKKGFVSQ